MNKEELITERDVELAIISTRPMGSLPTMSDGETTLQVKFAEECEEYVYVVSSNSKRKSFTSRKMAIDEFNLWRTMGKK